MSRRELLQGDDLQPPPDEVVGGGAAHAAKSNYGNVIH
jgi:hypothetical protein